MRALVRVVVRSDVKRWKVRALHRDPQATSVAVTKRGQLLVFEPN